MQTAQNHAANNNIFLRLIKDMKAYKWYLLSSVTLSVIQVSLTVYLPILLGQAINQTIAADRVNFTELSNILVTMGIVIAANAFVQWLNPLLFNHVTFHTVRELRNQVLNKLHTVPISFIDTHSTGDLVSRITTDTEQLGDGLLMVFNQFFIGVLTILITIFTMAQLDTVMMILVVILTPLSLFVSRLIAAKSYHLFQKQTASRGVHADYIEESVQQSEIITLFNAQEKQIEQFEEINAEYSHNSKWAIFSSSTVNPTTRFINALIYAAVTFLGALRIISGTFTVGELTTFLNYANQYTKPFNDISNVLAEIQSALACAERLYQIIDHEEEVETGLRLMRTDEVEGKISFNKVEFSYSSEQPLIDNLTLSVQPGQMVAIVGPTGAGKSTLINLLMRFYDPIQGQILIDNQPITDFKRDAVREQFGMVLQETWIKHASIHDNIAYGYPDVSREQVIEAARAAHAHRFIELLPEGYDTILEDNGSKLSTGQRQLIAIARIFVEIPHMLILDEATSSIDTRTEILIQEAFNKLMLNRTSFIIAHRLSTIQNADLILVMKEGNIIEQGNHETLMKARGLYYTMQASRNVE